LAEPERVNERALANLERLPKQPLGRGLSGIEVGGRSRQFAGVAEIDRAGRRGP